MISRLHGLGRLDFDKGVEHYVVADDVAIYGVGNTEAEAVDDYEEWAQESDLLGAKVLRATPALVRQVIDVGGNIAWGVVDGVESTVDESEQAEEAVPA